jgi:uncharacterized coiled-coil protein SlyX
METQTTELEKKIDYLEKYVDDLNSVIIEQGRAISILEKKFKILNEKLNSSSLDGLMPHNDKPPHY